MAETVKLEGLDDLNRAIKELVGDLKRKVVRSALRDAAKPIQRAAVANAPVLKQDHPYRLPGTLKKSIVIKASKRFEGQGGEIGVYVAVRKRKGLGGKLSARNPYDPFYWRFVEFGTVKIAPRRFMTRAFDANAQGAIEIFQARLKTRIDKANSRK
ncbi:MAG: HK97-gp10 family putative phage morphogenesis protein [Aeromonas veronii]